VPEAGYEALTPAFNDVLLLMALCFLVAVPLTFLLARPKAATVAAL
jgi:hypothetical protein